MLKRNEVKSLYQINNKTNSNSENKKNKDNHIDHKNKQINFPISNIPNSKSDNKNFALNNYNENTNIKKKETERKDIIDIGEFLRNKRNEMK